MMRRIETECPNGEDRDYECDEEEDRDYEVNDEIKNMKIEEVNVNDFFLLLICNK